MPLSDQKSTTGASAQDLVDYINSQQSRMEQAQKNDLERLGKMAAGPARDALVNGIKDRAANMDLNDAFLERLQNGEHPGKVQWDMVQQKAYLMDYQDKPRLQQQADSIPATNLPPTPNARQAQYAKLAEDAVMSTPAIDSQTPDTPKVSKVGDGLKGALSRLKNSAADALERKGSEESLKQLRANNPDIIDEYKDLQKQMSDLKQDYLNAVDPTKSNDNSPAAIEKIKEDMKKVQEKMDALKAEHKGLAQLDRSKVGQLIHSGVRDAAKAVGSKLKT